MVDINRNESGTEVVRVEKREYKGKTYVDVRIWYQPNGGGELLPTKKGVAMTPEVWEQVQAVKL